DGDGYGAACDCEDLDPFTAPNRHEFCDTIDNDCDGEIDENAVDADEYYVDSDFDGYGDASQAVISCSAPAGYSLKPTDCDDANPGIRPGSPEICDGIDNDCDGTVDGVHCEEPEEPTPVEDELDGGCSGCNATPASPAGALALML